MSRTKSADEPHGEWSECIRQMLANSLARVGHMEPFKPTFHKDCSNTDRYLYKVKHRHAQWPNLALGRFLPKDFPKQAIQANTVQERANRGIDKK